MVEENRRERSQSCAFYKSHKKALNKELQVFGACVLGLPPHRWGFCKFMGKQVIPKVLGSEATWTRTHESNTQESFPASPHVVLFYLASLLLHEPLWPPHWSGCKLHSLF